MRILLQFEWVPHGKPHIYIEKSNFAIGDELPERYGFDKCRLDEELLKTILILALRSKSYPSLWTDAGEIGVLARNGATAGATAKWIERRTVGTARCLYRMIDFWQSRPNGQRFRGGRSRGPYRLGSSFDLSEFDRYTAIAFLSAVEYSVEAIDLAQDSRVLTAKAISLLQMGRFLESKRYSESALIKLYERSMPSMSGKGRREQMFALAEANTALANVSLELGRNTEGVAAARAAQRLFTQLKHPLGQASAFQIEAHLRGQFESPSENNLSIDAARSALRCLDSGPKRLRRGASRAYYVGTIGLRLSLAGRTREASKRLVSALRLATEASSGEWAGVWAFRNAQNAIAENEPASAEEYMELALTQEEYMSVSAKAALARVATELNIYLERRDEAEVWLEKARLYINRGMKHQERLVRKLEDVLYRH